MKRFLDGCQRAVTPQETLARISPHFGRIGITRLANLTGLDRIGLPVFAAYRPGARSVCVSQGKGASAEAAMVSAAMESIEVWHAERPLLPVTISTIGDLPSGAELCDIGSIPSSRETGPQERIMWSVGRDIVSGREMLVPARSVWMDLSLPRVPMGGGFAMSTNGLASGNTTDEAICHALYEIAERDALSLWRAGGGSGEAGLAADSVTDPTCLSLWDRLETAGFSVSVWDLSCDTGVAVYQCLILDERDERGHYGLGFGAHLSPGVALVRALTEAAQVRNTYISGARDDLSSAEFSEAARDEAREIAGMMRSAHRSVRRFSDLPDRSTEDFRTDVEIVLSSLAGTGHVRQVLVCDLSREDIGVPVVKVIVPGLEGAPDGPGYRPGPRASEARP